jgi:hypothetical protein
LLAITFIHILQPRLWIVSDTHSRAAPGASNEWIKMAIEVAARA